MNEMRVSTKSRASWTKGRRRRIWSALAVASALVLAACGSTSSSGSDDDSPVKVSYLLASAGLPILAAEEQGFFEDEGLDVELTGVPNGASALQVLGQDFDISLGTPTDIILSAASGRDIKIFSGAYEASSQTPLFYLAAPSDVTSVEELRGKNIGAPSLAGIAYYGLVNALDQAGLTTNDVNIVLTNFPDVQAQLEAGALDAALIVDPFSHALFANPDFHDLGDPVITISDPILIGAYASTSEWLDAHDEQRAAFIRAIQSANEWIAANEDEAREILVEALDLSAEAAAGIGLPTWRTDFTAADLDAWLDILEELDASPDGTLPTADEVAYQP